MRHDCWLRPWCDDRQVKFLYAGVDQNWTRNTGEDGRPGSVFIIARRASDVITDLCMAGRLSREHTTMTRTPRSA
jgi:hypothetical protein